MDRFRLNLVMAVVLVGLATAVYFSHGAPPAPKPALTSLNSASVKSIELDHRGSPMIQLRKRDGQWQLKAPVSASVAPYEVKNVLDIATAPCLQSIQPDQVKRSDLGLSPPHDTIKFDDTTVRVGAVEPLKYRRYVETGSRICLIDNPTTPVLNGNYAALVSKKLVPAGATITGVDLPDHTLMRAASGKKWTITPQPANMAPDAAQKLADAWAAARANWNKAVSDRSPAKGDQTVTLHLKVGKTLRFIVVKRSPHLTLERTDIAIEYVLPKSQGDALLTLAKKGRKAAPAGAASSAAPARPTLHHGRSG